jgi:DNA-binding Lrp family transcriptional regulator
MEKRMPVNKDYWPKILELADKEGKILAPERKTLDQYLAQKLKLSRPTVRVLLMTWEEEGRIRTMGDETRKLASLQILSPSKEKVEGKVLILIDWENLLKSLAPLPSQVFSVSLDIPRFIEKITQELGEIIIVIVFAPPHLISVYGETFQKNGFYPVYCPKIITKKGEEDTVDRTLIKMGESLIRNMKLTHLCIGAGDRDYSELVRKAKWKGLKVVVAPASEKSLSLELAGMVDKIIIFPKTK